MEEAPFYYCEYCPRFFKFKSSRNRHIKLHTGDKQFQCNLCESAFIRRNHLKNHMKTHDSNRPFQCSHCNRGFNTAFALSIHKRSHKRNSSNDQPNRLIRPHMPISLINNATTNDIVPFGTDNDKINKNNLSSNEHNSNLTNGQVKQSKNEHSSPPPTTPFISNNCNDLGQAIGNSISATSSKECNDKSASNNKDNPFSQASTQYNNDFQSKFPLYSLYNLAYSNGASATASYQQFLKAYQQNSHSMLNWPALASAPGAYSSTNAATTICQTMLGNINETVKNEYCRPYFTDYSYHNADSFLTASTKKQIKYVCEQCKTSFDRRKELEEHLVTNHVKIYYD